MSPAPPPARTGSRRVALRVKWTLALLAGGAVPVALLAYATLAIQRSGLETAERQLEVAIADHVTLVVDAVLEGATDTTQRVGAVLSDASLDPDARIRLARATVAQADAIASVALYDAKGALLDAIVRVETPSLPPTPETLPCDGAAVPRGGEWLPIVYAGDVAVVRWVVPVFSGKAAWGHLVATLAPDVLAARLVGISRDRFEGRDDGVILLDREGRVLAGNARGALAVGAPVLGHDLFASLRVDPGAFARPIAWATEFEDASGEPMVGSARSLPEREWAIVVRRPRSAVYAALGRSRRLLFEASAVAALVMVGLGSWLASRATRPIRALSGLAGAYARREFDAVSPLRTGDEFEDLGQSMSDMARSIAAGESEIARRAAVEADLSRYLPAPIAKSIAEGTRSLALGGERREVSVLFADVAAFTTFAETAPPERVVAFLNELFSILAEVVFRHGGTVDKFIGDSIMALFGAPDDAPDHVERALAAAEDMHRFVEANAPAWRASYGVEVRLGIGVSTGAALVGNLGSERRMEYTAIGDVVNVAARLEYLAEPGKTLVTDEVRTRAEGGFDFVSLGEHRLRGKQTPVAVWEIA